MRLRLTVCGYFDTLLHKFSCFEYYNYIRKRKELILCAVAVEEVVVAIEVIEGEDPAFVESAK